MTRLAATLAVLIMVASMAITIAVTVARHDLLDVSSPDLGLAVSFTVLGAFLLVRGPVRNLALIICAQGLSSALACALGALGDLAPAHTRLSEPELWTAWLSNFVWLPAVVLLTPLALLLPDGRLHGPRWHWPIRIVAVLAGAFVVLGVTVRLSVSDNRSYHDAPSPTGFLTVPPAVQNGLSVVLFGGLLLCVFVSLGSLVARRRGASGVERAQLTSLLYGMTITLAAIVGGQFLDGRNAVQFALGLFSVVPVATGIAVAVLRYRLFEIDKVVSRTVTYVLVLAVLAGIYVGVLVGLAALVPTAYGQLGVALATLLVSILAVPLTRRVRRVVDRRFNRSRFDAERVATAFASRLRARPERGDVPADLLEVVQRTVAPAHAAVWLAKS